jgi:hypothetical protein
MSEAIETSEPSAARARYFAKDGEGVQQVFGLKDAQPYLDHGYVEVDEAFYLASLPDLDTPPFPPGAEEQSV